MKAICIKTYYDKELCRTIAAGEEVELSQKRFEQLSTSANDAKIALVKEVSEKVVSKKKG